VVALVRREPPGDHAVPALLPALPRSPQQLLDEVHVALKNVQQLAVKYCPLFDATQAKQVLRRKQAPLDHLGIDLVGDATHSQITQPILPPPHPQAVQLPQDAHGQ
jgi:hypothetical protein